MQHVEDSSHLGSSVLPEVFFPFTCTTGRLEGLNSYFKAFVNPQDSVWRFVQQYEVLQETMLDREDNQAFISATAIAPLYSRYRFERQAVGFYTRNVFGKFQAEVTASTGFVMNQFLLLTLEA